MRRALFAVLAGLVLTLAFGSTARAQSPAPDTTADVVDDDTKPWGRLAVFVPLSAALGAGAVLGRRYARERGWLTT